MNTTMYASTNLADSVSFPRFFALLIPYSGTQKVPHLPNQKDQKVSFEVHIRMAANKQIRYEQLFKYLTLICEQQN
jgi:hypothetical protein